MSANGNSAIGGFPFTAKMLEDAMAKAVHEAVVKGITDPDEIKRLKHEARLRVKKGL